ncbi:MAG: hypothetical protein HQK83_01815 [Fibrobacteria bacterium]|nr:hypothetical protein [Fibrobacteria bacterium]
MIRVLVLTIMLLPVSMLALEYTFPGTTWETATPEEVGLDAGAVNTAASQLGGHGAIIRYGYVVKVWGSSGLAASTDWASSCKPIFSLMIWKAIHDGKVESFQTLVKDIMTDQTFNEKDSKIQLYHLAHMTSGWGRAEDPGDAFSYNDWAINLYGKAVYHYIFKESGTTPSEIMQSELSMLQFEHDPGLHETKVGRWADVSVGDAGRMAHLFLNDGNWNGTQVINKGEIYNMLGQVVPADLPITKAEGDMSFNSGTLGGRSTYQNDGNMGPGSYSFNFWLNANKKLWPDLDTNVFQGNGHFGRENYTIFPNEQLIVIHYGNTFSNSQMNSRYKPLLEGVTSNPIEPINEIGPAPVNIQETQAAKNKTINIYSTSQKSGLVLGLPVFSGIGKLRIVNTQGLTLVQERVHSGDKFNWDTKQIKPGVYFAELNAEGLKVRRKLTLTH